MNFVLYFISILTIRITWYLKLSYWMSINYTIYLNFQKLNSCFISTFYSRVSVIRGQVITPQGLGIVGIRVSVDKDSRFGFTLTRTGGW